MKDSFSIRAVAARTGTSALNVAKQYGAEYASTSPEEVFNDPDVDLVLISSRHDLHARLAIDAARHGKRVFLEKPAALTEEELQELISVFRTSGVPLMVGFNRRFSPFMREAKSVLDQRSGPFVLTYRMNAGYVAPTSWIHGAEGGGRIIGECCHIFDLFNYLTGRFPEEIVALPLRPSAEHVLGSDNFSTTLRYADGSVCTLTYTSLGSTEVPKESMEVFFDGKAMLLDDYRRLHFHGMAKKPLTTMQQEKGHREELNALVGYFKGGPAPMTLDEIESATHTSFVVDELVRATT
jgi:predicted dehydrogenase